MPVKGQVKSKSRREMLLRRVWAINDACNYLMMLAQLAALIKRRAGSVKSFIEEKVDRPGLD
jgi:hypothetical protein